MFLRPIQGIFLGATNHELIPAFRMKVYYEYYTPLVENRLYYAVTLTCVVCDWMK